MSIFYGYIYYHDSGKGNVTETLPQLTSLPANRSAKLVYAKLNKDRNQQRNSRRSQ